MEAGADDYLIKPFSARELLARVRAHLEMTRLRREAEMALRHSEKLFRELADNAPLIIWMTDDQGNNEFVNKAYLTFFGVARGCRRAEMDGTGPSRTTTRAASSSF